MADNKWIRGLTAKTPVEAAARKVLASRLSAVRKRIAPALKRADEDTEHIHQLRVATRRARAAIDLFKRNLSDKAYRKARRALRRIRRGAGDARDWDIFLHDIEQHLENATPQRRAGLLFLAGFANGKRLDAQDVLRDEISALNPTWLGAKTLDTIHAAKGTSTFGKLAEPCLRKLLDELSSAMRGNLDDYGHLHQVRIAGKRLRYAMEIFAGCYAEPFREKYYPAIEQMQEILGDANDSHTEISRLEALQGSTPPHLLRKMKSGVQFLQRYHERRLRLQQKKFERWLRQWRKLESALAEVIAGNAAERSQRRTATGPVPKAVVALAAVPSRPAAEDQATAASPLESQAAVVPFPVDPPAASPDHRKEAEG